MVTLRHSLCALLLLGLQSAAWAQPAPASPWGANSPSAPGPLVITSTPDNAAVVVDGKGRGMTPLTLPDQAAGDHLVELRWSDGRQVTVIGRVEPGVGGTLQINAPGAPAAPAGSSWPGSSAPTGIAPMAAPPIGTGAAAPGNTEERVRWYRPSAKDAMRRWNHVDPWGGPLWRSGISAGLIVGFQTVLADLGGSSSSPNVFDKVTDKSFGEFGIIVGNRLLAGMIGALAWGGDTNGNVAPYVGLAVGRGLGRVLYDARIPDVQFGILYPDLLLRYTSAGSSLIVQTELLGFQYTHKDFLKIQLRLPSIGLFCPLGSTFKASASDHSVTGVGLSVGGSLEASVLF